MLSLKTKTSGMIYFIITTMLISQILTVVFAGSDIGPLIISALLISLATSFTYMYVHHHFYTVRHNRFATAVLEDIMVFESAITLSLMIISDRIFDIPPSDGVLNASLFAVLISLIPAMIYSWKSLRRTKEVSFPRKKVLSKEETHHVFIIESNGELYTAFIKGNEIESKAIYYDRDGCPITIDTKNFE